MTKKVLIAIFAMMTCCTAAEGSGEPPANGSAFQMRGNVEDGPKTTGTARIHAESAPKGGEWRPLGTEGLFYLLLAAFGAFAVALAGYMLIAARRGGRDAAHLLLGGLGYILLIVAAFGLIMLNR